MDIQYRTVLMNVALLSCHPEALPSHIDLADGVVQVSDEASFGTGGGFTTAGTPFGLDQSGPAGSRQVSEQWGTDAVTDPRQVTALQDLYRAALGLPPSRLPTPSPTCGAPRRRRAGKAAVTRAARRLLQGVGPPAGTGSSRCRSSCC
jgi:hypothetical protein